MYTQDPYAANKKGPGMKKTRMDDMWLFYFLKEYKNAEDTIKN